MYHTVLPSQFVARSLARIVAAACAFAFIAAYAADSVESEEPVKLSSFEVTAQQVESKNYKVEHSLTATKTDTPLLNVPQSITIVTEQQIKDQQMLSLGDVVRYVPGITAIQGENNRDQIVFRGDSSSADFYIDGVRDDVQYYRDLYNLTRVEVLRGPNAMIFGRGAGGGLINRVTKEAGFTPISDLTLQAGSFADARATVDFNQPVSAQAAFRVNAMMESSGSFRYDVHLDRQAVNPTVTFVPGQQTKITVGYEYLNDTRIADRGVTSFQGRPVSVPVSTYYGNPDDSRVQANVNLVSALIEHQAGGLNIRNLSIPVIKYSF